MDDLRARFATMDRIPVPDVWAEVDRRTEAFAATGIAPVVQTARPRRIVRPDRDRAGLRLVLVAAMVLSLLLIALAVIGGQHPDKTLPAVVAPSAAPSTAANVLPTAAPSATSTAAASPTPVPSPTPDPAAGCTPPAPSQPVVSEVKTVHYWFSATLAGCGLWLDIGTDESGKGLGIEHVDVGSGAQGATMLVGDQVASFATRDDALWAIDIPDTTGRSSLIRIDPNRSKVVDRIDLPFQAEQFVFVGDEAWILSSQLNAQQTHRSAVIRVFDMGSRAVTDTFVVPGWGTFESIFGVGFGAVWMKINDGITRIDTDTHGLSTLDVRSVGQCLVTDDWLYCGNGWGQVMQISPTIGQVVNTLQLPDWPSAGGDLALGSDGQTLWVQPDYYFPSETNGHSDATQLLHIDAATDSILATYDLAAKQPFSLIVAAGSVWMGAEDRPLIRWQIPTTP